MRAQLSQCVRAPALSLHYQQSSGCTVCCGSVATGNRSMITQRALGVLKLGSEQLPHEREGQQWAAAAICNSRPVQLSAPLSVWKAALCSHCVPRFRRFRAAFYEVMTWSDAGCYFKTKEVERFSHRVLLWMQSCHVFSHDPINESMTDPLSFVTRQ